MSSIAFSLNRSLSAAALASCVALMAGVAWAKPPAPFPSQPITWIVGYPAGGTVDVTTRLVAKKLAQALGQPVVVDNRPGATGAIALRAAAKAPSDGHTLITVPGPVLTNTPPPQIGKELTAVAMLAKGATVLVGTAGPGAPQDLKALLSDASKNPDKYSFGSSGNGTGQHLTGELINMMAGTKMTHVPYKGGGQAVTDVIGGQIPLAVLGLTPVLPHIKSGKLKAYGVSTATRSPSLPEVPTLKEAGLPNFDASQWFVVAAPSGVPADRIAKINNAIGEILRQADVVSSFAELGVTPAPTSAEETARFVDADLKRWRALVQKAKLPLE